MPEICVKWWSIIGTQDSLPGRQCAMWRRVTGGFNGTFIVGWSFDVHGLIHHPSPAAFNSTRYTYKHPSCQPASFKNGPQNEGFHGGRIEVSLGWSQWIARRGRRAVTRERRRCRIRPPSHPFTPRCDEHGGTPPMTLYNGKTVSEPRPIELNTQPVQIMGKALRRAILEQTCGGLRCRNLLRTTARIGIPIIGVRNGGLVFESECSQLFSHRLAGHIEPSCRFGLIPLGQCDGSAK